MRIKASLTPETLGRYGLYALPALGAASLLFVMHFQLANGAHSGTHIDEYYYSACAMRGLDTGAIPVPGCHDNKGPVTYLLYEAVFRLAGGYNYLAVKLVSWLLLLSETALLGRAAFRLAGPAAAIMTASLLLLCRSSDVANLALRTDTVGSLLLALGLAVLVEDGALRSPLRLGAAGLALGMAAVTKQPYAFAGLGVMLWLLLNAPEGRFGPALLLRGAMFGLGALAPFAVFWLVFSAQNASTDFLFSFFVYPATYGASHGNAIASLVRHVATLLAGLMDQFLLVALAAAAMAAVILSRPAGTPDRFADPRWLLVFVAAFLGLALAALPVWFSYYIVPLAGPMALLVGVVFGDHWPGLLRTAPRMAAAGLFGILFGVVMLDAQTWRSNGRNEFSLIPPRHMPLVRADGASRYAFQLGTQPDFYAEGGFIPASSVQFAWALPGTPDNWAYTRPGPHTWLRQLLDRQQARNLARLYRDFAATPPSYIMLDSDYVRAAASPNAVDIPGLQNYLDLHCRPLAMTAPRPAAVTRLYDCTAEARPQ